MKKLLFGLGLLICAISGSAQRQYIGTPNNVVETRGRSQVDSGQNYPFATASKILVTDANKNVISSGLGASDLKFLKNSGSGDSIMRFAGTTPDSAIFKGIDVTSALGGVYITKTIAADKNTYDLANFGNYSFYTTVTTDANSTIAVAFFGTINLTATLTADRTITLSGSPLWGSGTTVWLVVSNPAVSSFKWTITNTVKDVEGNPITALKNHSSYYLTWNGSFWIATNTSIVSLTAQGVDPDVRVIYNSIGGDTLFNRRGASSPSITLDTNANGSFSANLRLGTNGKLAYFGPTGLATAPVTVDSTNNTLTLDNSYILKSTYSAAGITETISPTGEIKYLLSTNEFGRVFFSPLALGGIQKGSLTAQSVGTTATRSSVMTVSPDSAILGTNHPTGSQGLTTYIKTDSASIRFIGMPNKSTMLSTDSVDIVDITGKHFKVPGALFGGSGTRNIYNADSTLAGNRTITTGGRYLFLTTATIDTAGFPFAKNFETQYSGSDASGQNVNFGVVTNETTANTTGTTQGIMGVVKVSHSTGSALNTQGISSNIYHAGNGTSTSIRAFQANMINNSSSGVITQAIGFYYPGSVITGTGTVTDDYGLYLGTAVAGGGTITNRHGVFQQDAAADNKFNGPMLLPNLTQRSIDTSTYKVVVTASDGTLSKMYWPSGSGGTPTLQQVLTAGATLTGTNTINNAGSLVLFLDQVEMAGFSPGLTTKSNNYTVTSADATINVNANSADITITLPASAPEHGVWTVVKTDGSTHKVTIDPNTGNSINGGVSSGSNTVILNTQFQAVTIQAINAGAYEVLSTNGFSTNTQTGTTYTLGDRDNGKLLTFNNASNITVTVNQSLPLGFSCSVMQLGAGQVIFSAGSGASIHNAHSFTKTSVQYSVATISNYGVLDNYITYGDMQ